MLRLSHSRAGRGKHLNTGTVACRFKEREAERILLGTEDAANQPFPILSHPITPAVFSDFEVVRRQYRPRCEGRHAHSANLLHQCSFERLDKSSDCH
jgi:hypothetical protein